MGEGEPAEAGVIVDERGGKGVGEGDAARVGAEAGGGEGVLDKEGEEELEVVV